MNLKVKFKRISDLAQMPKQAHPGDAMDLHTVESVYLHKHDPHALSTGWIIEMPENTRAWITPRSGLSLKGVTVWNAPGLIDQGYRGELKVILVNCKVDDYLILPGDRIAQISFQPIYLYEPVEESGELSETARGANGFGSTGR